MAPAVTLNVNDEASTRTFINQEKFLNLYLLDQESPLILSNSNQLIHEALKERHNVAQNLAITALAQNSVHIDLFNHQLTITPMEVDR